MRNALKIDGNLVITTDNSGGIGEKQADLVSVPDRTTAYFAARVALFEQWAAHAKPIAVLLQNFSGQQSWLNYVQGITDLFQEAGLKMPTVTGSTETNMGLLQSAVAVTMIGKCQEPPIIEDVQWFTYGKPLVGHEVMTRGAEVAQVQKVKQALEEGIVTQIWPVGSQGILKEVRRIFQNEEIQISAQVDIKKSAGPSAVVLLAVPRDRITDAKEIFQDYFYELTTE